MHRRWRISVAALALSLWGALLLSSAALAQEITYFALKGPGQGSVALDRSAGRAYVVDYGRREGASALTLEGLPVVEALTKQDVKELFVLCSHPHADHIGGLRELLSDPATFIKPDGTPRFDRIVLADPVPGLPKNKSLQGIFRKALRTPAFKQIAPQLQQAMKDGRLGFETAWGKDVFKSYPPPPVSAIRAETLQYTTRFEKGPHGESTITLFRIGDLTVVDLDDAGTDLIQEVTRQLGEKKGARESFVIVSPHHGSRYTDIKPLLALKPRAVIVSVDPANRYLHPGMSTLASCYEDPNIGVEKVFFTGSSENLVITQDGVKATVDYATRVRTYRDFIEPQRPVLQQQLETANAKLAQARNKAQKAEALRRVQDIEDQLDAFKRVTFALLSHPPPDGTPPPPDVAAYLAKAGHLLSPEHRFGHLRPGGKSPSPGGNSGPDFRPPGAGPADMIVIDPDPRPSPGPARLTLQQEAHVLTQVEASPAVRQANRVAVYARRPGGRVGDVDPVMELTRADLARMRARAAKQGKMPNGGMVYLAGAELQILGDSNPLLLGRLDLCGESLCLKYDDPEMSPTGDRPVLLPFKKDDLFLEVWDRTYERGIDAFYLSINPTRAWLAKSESNADDDVPHDVLTLSDTLPPSERRNEVVTDGDIQATQIGHVLLDADVLFKSAALGRDVRTGESLGVSGLGASGERALSGDPEDDEEDDTLAWGVDFRQRWCRYFWSSAPQSMWLNAEKALVHFEGAAVRAQAEAMIPRGGRLESFPKGAWCEGPREMARRLNKLVEQKALPGALDELQSLREIGAIQNFAKWARDNHVALSDEFRAWATSRPSAQHPLPRWSSGIQSKPVSIIREEYSPRRAVIHYYFTDVKQGLAAMDDAMAWLDRELMSPSVGCRRKVSFVIGAKQPVECPPEVDIGEYVSKAAKRLGQAAGSEIMPMEGTPPMPQGDVSFGIVPHLLSYSIHGGVLLQALALSADKEAGAAFLASTARAPEPPPRSVFSPNGRPVFRRDDSGHLHFWRFGTDETQGQFEHLVVSAANVEDAYVSKGTWRFLLVGNGSIEAFHEISQPPSAEAPAGREWLRSVDLKTSLDAPGMVMWKASDESARMAYLSLGALSNDETPHFGFEKPGIRVLPAPLPNHWVVELSPELVREEIDAIGNPAVTGRNQTEALRAADLYLDWGFDHEASELIEQLQEWNRAEVEEGFALRKLKERASSRDLLTQFVQVSVMPASPEARRLKQVLKKAQAALDEGDGKGAARAASLLLTGLEPIRTLPRQMSGTFEQLVSDLLTETANTPGLRADVKERVLSAADLHRRWAKTDMLLVGVATADDGP